jgi:glutamate--cysteine ligase
MSTEKITEEKIKEKVYETFIKPTINRNKDYIGIEIEIPIINIEKKPVNFNVVHIVTKEFLEKYKNFKTLEKDHKGNITQAINTKTNDIISYDCSYNNLEFSMGKETNLYTIKKRFCNYYNNIKHLFEKYNHTLTGMGVNPHYKLNKNIPIPSERYLMLYHHLKSYKQYNEIIKFHNHPEYGAFSSASQVQLDVNYNNLIDTINTFNKLEPIKAVLFSNSILIEENENLICSRDMLWENSTHGINPHNVGMFQKDLKNIDDLLNYLLSLDIYCVMRGNLYINFKTMNILDYFKSEKIYGEYQNKGKYAQIEIKPELDDIKYLRSFKFENITYRGTIEYRSVCTQPMNEIMTVSAFHLGLKHKLEELKQLIENDTSIYNNKHTPSELRKLFTKNKLPPYIDEDKLYQLTKKVVDLSYEGLKSRGKQEETFLNPLYKRIQEKTNPAKKELELKNKGASLNKIIELYGNLNY